MSKVIVTVHGIRWKSHKDWQNDLADYIKRENPLIKVFNFRYGHIISIMSWLISVSAWLRLPFWVRARYVKKLVKFLYKIKKKIPHAEISIIGHSFGGWLIEQAMIRDDEIEFDNVIFMHSPIDSHIENTSFWNWLEFGRIRRVFSWSSHSDIVIGKVAIKPFGQNGYWGFIRHDHPEDRKSAHTKPYAINLYNIVTSERHSGVVKKIDKYGKQIYRQLVGETEEIFYGIYNQPHKKNPTGH